MASFIVEGVGPNGVRTWVVIEGSNTNDARTKSNQILEQGFFPNIVAPADASGVATLNSQSPGFSARFPSNNYTTERIVSDLGGVVQPDLTPPPPVVTPPFPGGGEGEGVPGMLRPIRGGGDAEFGPQFRAGLADRGITLGGGGGIEGRLAEQARTPFFSRALASAAFGDSSLSNDEEGRKAALPSFQEMVRTGALYGGGGAQQARDLLTQAQGFGSDFTGRGELAGSVLNPGTVQEGSNLANIAREAGRQRFGSFARFLPQAGSLSEGFFAQPETGAQTFADFLSNKIFGA
jgi:hypothetical protein